MQIVEAWSSGKLWREMVYRQARGGAGRQIRRLAPGEACFVRGGSVVSEPRESLMQQDPQTGGLRGGAHALGRAWRP